MCLRAIKTKHYSQRITIVGTVGYNTASYWDLCLKRLSSFPHLWRKVYGESRNQLEKKPKMEPASWQNELTCKEVKTFKNRLANHKHARISRAITRILCLSYTSLRRVGELPPNPLLIFLIPLHSPPSFCLSWKHFPSFCRLPPACHN